MQENTFFLNLQHQNVYRQQRSDIHHQELYHTDGGRPIWLIVRRPTIQMADSPKSRQSEGSIVRRIGSPKGRQSEGPIDRKVDSPRDRQTEASVVRNCFPFCKQFSVIRSVYISVDTYSRVCASYEDFIDRGLMLIRQLLNQGSLNERWKSSLRYFFGHHHYMVVQYEISSNYNTYFPTFVTTNSLLYRL